MRKLFVIMIGSLLLCSVAGAQQSQTGSIEGTVTLEGGEPLPGVAVSATTATLPRARSTETDANGIYRFAAMPPGAYELTFTMQGFATEKMEFPVSLQQKAIINVTMRDATFEGEIMVTAETPTIDTTSAELKATISDEVIEGLPVGQQYSDLVKLVPGVQYTEDGIRGPSAGGSGQDNSYNFDGVSVSLPQYGTLSTEPATQDIEEVAVVKGGANAVGFNRSGGFLINTLSRSGTNQFRGELSYQVQTDAMTSAVTEDTEAVSDPNYDWLVASIGGPIIPEMLYFYASYFRPTEDQTNRANVYGDRPDYSSTRDEFFGKLTFTPTNSLLFSGSYRDSETNESGVGVGEYEEASVSYGNDSKYSVAVLEGTWMVSNNGLLSFKYGEFKNPGSRTPDNVLDFQIRADGSASLDVDNLDQQGYSYVPVPIVGNDDYNAFIAPIVERYGYEQNGVPTGGGAVGTDYYFNNQDFYNTSFQIGYDHYIKNHQLHIGYRWELGEEDLVRYSNGWGRIYVRGGTKETADGTPVFYEARVFQASLVGEGGQPLIAPHHSEMQSQIIELNDVIRLNKWTLNLGVSFANDKLYGQGLRPNSSNPSGFELAQGNKYLMKEIGFDEMISPRLGVTWSPNGKDSLYGSYARYYPAVSSLPRAASWDRNLALREIYVQFDADGNFLAIDPLRASSGKLFQEGIDPRSIDEFVVGFDKQISRSWTGRIHARYRKAQDFWEDTQNNARSRFNAPEGYPQEDYIPGLGGYDELGLSDGSYVIAQLDNAFTKYYELSAEAEWRGSNAFFRGSYVWSHYYGTFDQDNTTYSSNDTNTFVGSSYIADGAGRQIWQNRYGNLKGDRRHQLKLYGFYNFDWNGVAGAFAIYQSGQPWEVWGPTEYYSGTWFASRLRRSGRVPHQRRPLPARSQLYPELPLGQPLQHPASRRGLQRPQQTDGVRLRTDGQRGRLRRAEGIFRPAALPADGRVPVLRRTEVSPSELGAGMKIPAPFFRLRSVIKPCFRCVLESVIDTAPHRSSSATQERMVSK